MSERHAQGVTRDSDSQAQAQMSLQRLQVLVLVVWAELSVLTTYGPCREEFLTTFPPLPAA